MKFCTTALALAFTSIALAIPYPDLWQSQQACLTADSAKYLVNGFVSLISDYKDAVAEALLYKDFTDKSDSINSLAQYPLGSVTFPSKAAFKAGQGAQPKVPMTVVNIDAVTCDTVAFRWLATPGNPAFPVQGINTFKAVKTGNGANGWQIKAMYSEFNSLAWWQAIGGGVTPPARST